MNEPKLWPVIKPFNEDYLQVSKIHKIRFALYGNPKGKDRLQEHIHRLIEESDYKAKKKWCTILAEYEYSFF